jgi:hypothetical protein
MADYEKTRRKKEAEANARTEKEREERRIKEEKERQRVRKEIEKRRWDELGLEKQRAKHSHDIDEASRRTQELVKQLEEKKLETPVQITKATEEK